MQIILYTGFSDRIGEAKELGACISDEAGLNGGYRPGCTGAP